MTYRIPFEGRATRTVVLVCSVPQVQDEDVTRVNGLLAESNLAHVGDLAFLTETQKSWSVLVRLHMTEAGVVASLESTNRSQSYISHHVSHVQFKRFKEDLHKLIKVSFEEG